MWEVLRTLCSSHRSVTVAALANLISSSLDFTVQPGKKGQAASIVPVLLVAQLAFSWDGCLPAACIYQHPFGVKIIFLLSSWCCVKTDCGWKMPTGSRGWSSQRTMPTAQTQQGWKEELTKTTWFTDLWAGNAALNTVGSGSWDPGGSVSPVHVFLVPCSVAPEWRAETAADRQEGGLDGSEPCFPAPTALCSSGCLQERSASLQKKRYEIRGTREGGVAQSPITLSQGRG